VDAIDESRLRRSFVNCSKGEVARMNVPPLADVAWDRLEFLGWRDPKAPDRGYLVTPWRGEFVGIALRAATRVRTGLARSSMCSLCLTVHAASGVTLFTAALAGSAGRNGNSAGTYICENLQCSRYVRGELKSAALIVPTETLDLATRLERLRLKAERFIEKILGGTLAGPAGG
jgi:FBP C-terminal treble-clef zinc-finger